MVRESAGRRVAHGGHGAASLVFFFKPVLAPILTFLVLGERIPLSMQLGIALILAGSLCLVLAKIRDLRMVHAHRFAAMGGRRIVHWRETGGIGGGTLR